MLTATRRSLSEAVAAIAATGLVVGSVTVSTGDQATRPMLLDYEERFLAVARDIGRLLEIGDGTTPGLKRAIGAIDRGELDGEELAGHAHVWQDELQSAVMAMRAVPVPAGLGTASALVIRSYHRYQDVARTLGRIPSTSPGIRDRLLDQAVALGSEGDEAFDAAAAVIQGVRRDVGLPSQPSLPDPERVLPEGVEIYDPQDLYPEDGS